MEENQQSDGRVFAAKQILTGMMDKDQLMKSSEECIPMALERGDVERAEFWVGIREQALLFKMQEIPYAQRQEEAEFEMVYVFPKEGEPWSTFCYREETAELAKEIAVKARGNLSYLTVRPAYFEECGALCLTNIPYEERYPDNGKKSPEMGWD